MIRLLTLLGSVLEAGQRGKITTYIVCLAVTSGQSAFNPAANLGVGYNIFVGLAKGLGFVPYVGDGTGVVSTVRSRPSYSCVENADAN